MIGLEVIVKRQVDLVLLSRVQNLRGLGAQSFLHGGQNVLLD
jgi:hypothetical protein